jgi:hypothetical protein
MADKRILTDWIEGYIEYTADEEPPRKFHEWMSISVIAAALQRKCCLRWGSLIFYPNFYIILVAPAGRARKGTAMAIAEKYISEMMIPLSPDTTSLQALISRMCECTNTEEETEEGYFESHSSLTAFAPELTVFLGFANKELISALCDFYDCRPRFEYRTISRGIEEIVGVYLNLIGATTPELIKGSMSAETIGTGLPSRMIFVYEHKIEKRVVCPFYMLSPEGQELKRKLIEDLTKIRSLKGDFKVSKDFLGYWTEWYGNYPDECPFDPAHFGSYWERKPAHVMKLSMVMSASRSNDKIIQVSDLKRSIKLIEETEHKMPYVFQQVGTSSQAENIQRIMNFIAMKREISTKDLMKEFILFVTQTELDGILSALHMSGFIKAPVIKSGLTIIRHKDPTERASTAFVQNPNEGSLK